MSDRPPLSALALVLGGIVSVQFGAAIAVTLIPIIGVGGSVFMRLVFATAFLLLVARPTLRGHSRAAWGWVLAFGLALGFMNWSFYGALSHLPIGVAVTVEFCGPLILAAVLSKRPRDFIAVAAALVGVVLISEALQVPLADLSWLGLLLAATAGALWAAYIVTSSKVGASFPKLDGLALAMVVAGLVVLPAGIVTVPTWTTPELIKGFGIALLSSVVPYSLELMALRRLSAQIFGILLSLEPAVAALAGLLILGQRLSAWQLAGMGLVVAASVIVLGLGAGRTPVVEETP